MKISKTVKKIAMADLMIGLAITAMLWMSIGTEGMAERFCSLIAIEKCNEIEWSERESELYER